MFLRETIDGAGAVLMNAADQVVGDANVQSSVRSTGEYVDIMGHNLDPSAIVVPHLVRDPRLIRLGEV